MNIGDKVRFLNDVGGGIVTGFQGKGIVLVQDEDGFDYPVSIHDCVVVSAAGQSEAAPTKPLSAAKPQPVAAPQPQPVKASTTQPSSSPVYERRGAEALNLVLAFVPVEDDVANCAEFDAYLINDSNYFIDYVMLSGENTAWFLRSRGTVEPNTKEWLLTVHRTDTLNEFQNLCVQTTAYKQGKTFALKQPQSVQLRLDLKKFYQPHAFQQSDFFEEAALTLPLLTNDKAEKTVFASTSPDELRDALLSHSNDDAPIHIHAIRRATPAPDQPEEVDLHARELLDSVKGLKPNEILEYQLEVFRRKMNSLRSRRGHKVVFIHGKGNGTLRQALLKELVYSYKNCTYQDASFRQYGFGATLVIIH